MGRETVSECVRARSRIKTGRLQVFREQAANTASRESAALVIQKHRWRFLPELLEERSTIVEPAVDCLHRIRPQKRQALLLSLAANRDDTIVQVNAQYVQPDQFGNTNS